MDRNDVCVYLTKSEIELLLKSIYVCREMDDDRRNEFDILEEKLESKL